MKSKYFCFCSVIISLSRPLRSSSPPSLWSTSSPSAQPTWPTVSVPLAAGGRSACTRVPSTRSLDAPTWTSSSPCSWGACSRPSTGRCEAPRCSATASDPNVVVPQTRTDTHRGALPCLTQTSPQVSLWAFLFYSDVLIFSIFLQHQTCL